MLEYFNRSILLFYVNLLDLKGKIMGDTDNVMDAAEARDLIINFFSIIENRQELFNEIIKILKEEGNFSFTHNDNIEAFQDCIVLGHFQWILDVTDKQIQTEFDSKYTTECSVSNNTFVKFYKVFDRIISNSFSNSKRAQRLLSKYSNFLTT